MSNTAKSSWDECAHGTIYLASFQLTTGTFAPWIAFHFVFGLVQAHADPWIGFVSLINRGLLSWPRCWLLLHACQTQTWLSLTADILGWWHVFLLLSWLMSLNLVHTSRKKPHMLKHGYILDSPSTCSPCIGAYIASSDRQWGEYIPENMSVKHPIFNRAVMYACVSSIIGAPTYERSRGGNPKTKLIRGPVEIGASKGKVPCRTRYPLSRL